MKGPSVPAILVLVFNSMTFKILIMPSTQQLLEDYPRKLIFLGNDAAAKVHLESKLKDADDGNYDVIEFNSLSKVKAIDLPSYCHGVILDMRGGEDYQAEAIKWIGELQCPVALICLCQDYHQMLAHQERLHLVDDIVVGDSLEPGELPLRITRAILNRRAGLERRQDQELLSALLDNVPDSIYFKDRDCRFIRVNAAKANKHKTHPGQMVGQSDFDYFTEERARPAFEEEQQIMRSDESVLGEVQKLTFEDGSIGWVNTSKLVLKDKFGRVIGTMGISRDITAQKEGEQDQALLNELLESIPDAIYFKDKKSRFIRVNKAMAEKYGQAVDTLIGKSDFDLFTEAHARPSYADEQKIMRTGEAVVGKLEKKIFEDGRVVWVNTTKVPLHNKSGEIIGTMGISRDVTQQVENEQKLERAPRKLDGD
jgi:PAS domain S-box-containing protein